MLGLLLLIVLPLRGSLGQACVGYDCLKEYVEREDGAYTWSDTGERIVVSPSNGTGGWTGYILNMTSQQWLTPEKVSRSVWWHILVVIVPDIVETVDTTVIYMTGGSNSDDFRPDVGDTDILIISAIATSNRVVTSALFQIPNQKIVYADDPEQKERSEDSNIAWTWLHFLKEPSETDYLLRLPMTKAGVKALDTVENFLTSSEAPTKIKSLNLSPTHHIVAGASKRGWTTWTVGAVDPRVMAIAPIVMDELNFVENIHHHYRSLGGWSFALDSYWELNITTFMDDPKMQLMMDIVDPFSHRDKLVMPKLVCDSSGDEFFMPDDSRYWWHQMPMHQEMNRFITLPNAEHATVTSILELLPAVNTWLRAILRGSKALGTRDPPRDFEEREHLSLRLIREAQVPEYNWTISDAGQRITVQADRAPLSVHLWHASTCHAHANNRKDFRLVNLDSPCTCGIEYDEKCVNLAVLWAARELKETSPGSLTWEGYWPAPTSGQWTAFFLDLQFQGPEAPQPKGWPFGDDGTFEFTTSISIVPDTFPHEDCSGAGCMGTLV